ncbi:MAG TPA: IS200/IS605 family transposase [Candidatus Angelobacter sp.]|nr:IS200/IS605 family transposase [Candidatus Angelobacter sp.]
MSHAFVKNHIHLVFSTKGRKAIIAKDVQPELWSYLAGISRNHEMAAIAINGMADHVHILFHLPPIIALAKAVQLLKANSSKWMNEHRRQFAWQEGYSAFSVSVSNTPTVAKYIRNQEQHHRKMTFTQEYEALLRKHGIRVEDMPPR